MKWIEDEHDRDSLYRGTDANGIKAISEAMNLMDSEQAEIDKHTRLHQLTKEDLAYQIRPPRVPRRGGRFPPQQVAPPFSGLAAAGRLEPPAPSQPPSSCPAGAGY